MATDALIDELLIRGADDWVTAAEVAWVAKSAGGARTNDEIRTLSLALIRAVLVAGLMEAGDVTKDGFVGWGLPPFEAIARVEDSWKPSDPVPGLGEVCWLANTEVGDERVDSSRKGYR